MSGPNHTMAPMLGLVIVLASLIPHSIATPSLEECRARFVVKPASVADPDRQFDGKFSQQVLLRLRCLISQSKKSCSMYAFPRFDGFFVSDCFFLYFVNSAGFGMYKMMSVYSQCWR